VRLPGVLAARWADTDLELSCPQHLNQLSRIGGRPAWCSGRRARGAGGIGNRCAVFSNACAVMPSCASATPLPVRARARICASRAQREAGCGDRRTGADSPARGTCRSQNDTGPGHSNFAKAASYRRSSRVPWDRRNLSPRRTRAGQPVWQGTVIRRQRRRRRRAAGPAIPHRIWIHLGRAPHHRAEPGRTRTRGGVEFAAQQAGGAGRLEPQGPPVLATGVDLGQFHRAPRPPGPPPRRSPRWARRPMRTG